MPNLQKTIPTIFLIFIIATAFFVMVPEVKADPEDDSGFSMTVTGIRYLYLENGSLEFTPDTEQMLDGWTTTESSTAWVSANVPWALTIRGTEETWEGPWSKPVSDIYWRYGNDEFIPLSTDPVMVTVDGPVDAEQIQVDIKINLAMANDLPGNYSYAYVLFELSAP